MCGRHWARGYGHRAAAGLLFKGKRRICGRLALGWAQGDNGAPLGRDLEFAEVLRAVHRRGAENVVFLTADVHYTAALAPARG